MDAVAIVGLGDVRLPLTLALREFLRRPLAQYLAVMRAQECYVDAKSAFCSTDLRDVLMTIARYRRLQCCTF